MSIKYLNGDLIDMALNGYFDVIVHGCNCFCTMGAGIAKQIRYHFPDAYKEDKKTKYGDYNKLGNFTFVNVKNNLDQSLKIINAYTQYEYGRNKKNVDYRAIKSVFEKIYDITNENDKIGIPKIGCGLAGGEWTKIETIINKIFHNKDIFVVCLN